MKLLLLLWDRTRVAMVKGTEKAIKKVNESDTA